jgi:hypothetical protein
MYRRVEFGLARIVNESNDIVSGPAGYIAPSGQRYPLRNSRSVRCCRPLDDSRPRDIYTECVGSASAAALPTLFVFNRQGWARTLRVEARSVASIDHRCSCPR